MSYTVLARRYRSGTFDEVIGQDHVARTLKRAIESGRIAHAYLFCGTRGTGKTSTARILAKCLNCQKSDGPTPTPCNECESCKGIARGEDMDVIEIDAASNTGVDNVRDIIENAQYRPARSRFKIYIVDEVHMLSKNAFNALLKTLEEPPSHVKFILATTEPEKVLPTILSRCQRYDFRNIPTREIAQHLKEITKKEKIKADDDALLLVSKAGAGSMRDALSLLDRLLSVGEKNLDVDMIEQLLGLPKSQLLFDLAGAVAAGDVKSVLQQTDAIISGGLSPDGLVAALVDHLRNLLILRTCGADSNLVEVPGLALADMEGQSQQFDPAALTQDITLLEELRRQLRQSQAGRALLDATLVRMTLADQFASIGDLLARLDGNGGGSGTTAPRPRPAGSGVAPKLPVKSPAQAPMPPSRPTAADATQKKKAGEPVAGQAAPPAAEVQSSPAEIAPPQAVGVTSSAEDDDDDLPRPGKVWEGPSLGELMKSQSALSSKPASPKPLSAPTTTAPANAPAAGNVETVSVDDLPGVWKALLALLAQHGPSLHGVLSHGRLVGIEDGRAVIRYGPHHETFVKMLERNGKREIVRDAISRVLSQSVGVKFEVEVGEPTAEAVEPAEAPAPARSPIRPAATAAPPKSAPAPTPSTPGIRVTPELIETIRNSEPLVKALMDELGATIVKVESPTTGS